MKRTLNIGLLHSASGPYAALGMAARSGVLSGVADVNADLSLDVAFGVVERDPEGRLVRHAPLCRDMLQNAGVRHVFGCLTSSNRKEVIPELERLDGVLSDQCEPVSVFPLSPGVQATRRPRRSASAAARLVLKLVRL